jgi:hypothetical protein
MYGVICKQSTSPRGFFQMMNRCRKITDTNVMILNNDNMKFFNKNYMFNYDQIKHISLFEEDKNIIGASQVVYEQVGDKIVMKNDFGIFHKLYLHNKVELLNKTHYFMDVFVNIAKNKGHKVVFDEVIQYKKKEVVNYNITKLI